MTSRNRSPRTPSTSGDALLLARAKLRLTQVEFSRRLAGLLGHPVAASQVAKWERGIHVPRAPVLMAAAQLIGTDMHDLLAAGSSRPGTEARLGTQADLSDPRIQVLTLIEFGFPLTQALHLVRDEQLRPAHATQGPRTPIPTPTEPG